MSAVVILAIISIAPWIYLALLHGNFWQIEYDIHIEEPHDWPKITAIIPARNEADVIGAALNSIWDQNYPGRLNIILVDDSSEDGTAALAKQFANRAGRSDNLEVVSAPPLPDGWTGKVWAMHQGVCRANHAESPSDFLLFSDADIIHGNSVIRNLVARTVSHHLDLASYMVRLRCESSAERLMIPAFVFFFRLLYPFRRVNNLTSKVAAAAGGTMLIRTSALARIGGMEAIRSVMIDDCSLASSIKKSGGKLWLGLSRESVSTRAYGKMSEIVHMIARNAYAQLDYSPVQLFGSTLGLGIIFLLPPALALLAHGPAKWFGAAAWLTMSALYAPMVSFYSISALYAVLLPMIAMVYLWATAISAWRHYCGRSGEWKGRIRSAK